MKKENIMFLFAIATVVLIRGVILVLTILNLENHLFFRGHIVHHFWLGFILLGISFLLPKKHSKSRIVIGGIGFGILADELIFMILGGGGYANYWSPLSFIGMIACLLVIYLTRKGITTKFID